MCCDQGRPKHGCNVSLSNSKIRLFEKVNNFILLTKYFSLSFIYIYIFIRSDYILSCHMIMLQRAPQMLQCTPPTGQK